MLHQWPIENGMVWFGMRGIVFANAHYNQRLVYGSWFSCCSTFSETNSKLTASQNNKKYIHRHTNRIHAMKETHFCEMRTRASWREWKENNILLHFETSFWVCPMCFYFNFEIAEINKIVCTAHLFFNFIGKTHAICIDWKFK